VYEQTIILEQFYITYAQGILVGNSVFIIYVCITHTFMAILQFSFNYGNDLSPCSRSVLITFTPNDILSIQSFKKNSSAAQSVLSC